MWKSANFIDIIGTAIVAVTILTVVHYFSKAVETGTAKSHQVWVMTETSSEVILRLKK